MVAAHLLPPSDLTIGTAPAQSNHMRGDTKKCPQGMPAVCRTPGGAMEVQKPGITQKHVTLLQIPSKREGGGADGGLWKTNAYNSELSMAAFGEHAPPHRPLAARVACDVGHSDWSG